MIVPFYLRKSKRCFDFFYLPGYVLRPSDYFSKIYPIRLETTMHNLVAVRI